MTPKHEGELKEENRVLRMRLNARISAYNFRVTSAAWQARQDAHSSAMASHRQRLAGLLCAPGRSYSND